MSGEASQKYRRYESENSNDQKEDDESGLPLFNGGAYAAHGRVGNKPLYAIHFLSANGNGRTFQYVDMRSRCAADNDFSNDRFTLAFLGMRAVIVTVEGRNLLRLYDYIHQHRLPYVMEIAAGRDFAGDQETVVTRVTVSDHFDSSGVHRP